MTVIDGNSHQLTGSPLMAADLQGIRNVGDFFSQHYLEELLDAWSEREKAGKGQAPPKRLAALANPYFK